MAGLYEGGNGSLGSLKTTSLCTWGATIGSEIRLRKPAITGGGAHRAKHTIPPFWLDDHPPLLRHVGVRPAVGWSVLALRGL
ncbi:hypothetical protein ANN_02429 [Periplaneta americana]|uniref:Uncharacterized protein n=1 Tax=Periplaneta americana TaxID=6978 RepID=A0ABQ8TZQ8_PERAM|nr:hypothetical protein ANN_02429 [Periplaneta americana]